MALLLEDKNIAFQWIYKEAEAQSRFLVANHQYKCEKVQKRSKGCRDNSWQCYISKDSPDTF